MYELSDGAWRSLTSAVPAIRLPMPLPAPYFFLFVGNKVFLLSSASTITELRSSAFSEMPVHLKLIALPDGLEYRPHKRDICPWVDDSAIYIILARELQLVVWLYRVDTETWSLEDTICLRKVFSDSVVSVTPALVLENVPFSKAVNVEVLAVGSRCSGTRVLAQVGNDVVYIDIKGRTAEKVYTVTPEDGDSVAVIPFSMKLLMATNLSLPESSRLPCACGTR